VKREKKQADIVTILDRESKLPENVSKELVKDRNKDELHDIFICGLL
jgi:hypothetical protein